MEKVPRRIPWSPHVAALSLANRDQRFDGMHQINRAISFLPEAAANPPISPPSIAEPPWTWWIAATSTTLGDTWEPQLWGPT
jgi:hypothetical protein